MARKSSTDADGVTTDTDTGDSVDSPADTGMIVSARTGEPLSATPSPKSYVVLHGGVGPWWQGQTITDAHLAAGHDVQRLLDLGAIAEVGSEAAYQAGRDGLAGVTPVGALVTEPVPPPNVTTGPAPSVTTTGAPAVAPVEGVTAAGNSSITGTSY